ncbi:Importin subunit alpha-2 [Zea mays]|jgi:importin subunit alpha-6/7|uniref:Importin subunit alpha-2 n=1 Tax=Zea mays TaxID=4577 RepID=A0A1D6MNG1_MAIZE|nr:Importin subunit alpha-2 [Zea mays]
MSLRPSEREQMRKGNYKQTVDAEESRRRREGQMMDMRKAKREESLQKKRCDGFPASAAGVPPMGHSTALQQKVRCPLPCSSWPRSDPLSVLGYG